MAIQYDKCPSCRATIVKGAMRCTSCGALLTTAEEQKQRIQRYRENQRKPSLVGGIIKFIVLLFLVGVAWYFFSEQITTFIKALLAKF
jgi:uncharacterized membrane protein YvbJ